MPESGAWRVSGLFYSGGVSKTLWIVLVVAGLAAALGYGVTQEFLQLPVAAFIFFVVLAALASSGDVVSIIEVEAAPQADVAAQAINYQLPVGFHPE